MIRFLGAQRTKLVFCFLLDWLVLELWVWCSCYYGKRCSYHVFNALRSLFLEETSEVYTDNLMFLLERAKVLRFLLLILPDPQIRTPTVV